MFVRKSKTIDVQTSLQRFIDLNRDPSSRGKHFKLLIETLCTSEKRQLIDDYSFETFHLIDSLLLQSESTYDGSNVNDAELALWTLEQLLCLAPELIGKGWQKHAIENILKRSLLPNNLIGVRKIGIRLFIIWYQSLAQYNNAGQDLDKIFQCLLPYFPLHDGCSTERILQDYCESNNGLKPIINNRKNDHNTFNPGPIRRTPILLNPQYTSQISIRERAQLLQIYLDKFLDYVHRETIKIEWNEETKQLECAKFLLDRIIVLYIYQVFPDIETNGVDIYEGWEGNEETYEIMDTSDPIIISRYWLIRWITNIAQSTMIENSIPGLKLYRKALFISKKATNVLLTLMKESMQLPLACSNVIHKVLFVIKNWLLQIEISPFIENNLVTQDTLSLLLIHIMTNFFQSIYLTSSGDRLSSAVSVTHSILQITRDLSNPSCSLLPIQLNKRVWNELIKKITESVKLCCSRSDAYGRATAGGFVNTLLSITVYIKAIREIDIDDKIWDDIWDVFKNGLWQQMIQQWSKIVDNVTKALILNLFAIDINKEENIDNQISSYGTENNKNKIRNYITSSTSSSDTGYKHDKRLTSSKSDKSLENERGNNMLSNSDDEPIIEQKNTDKEMQSVVQSTGNTTNWLRVWMRILNLVDPADPKNSQQAVQTISRAIDTLLSIGCAQKLVHWLADKLLRLNVAQQPHAIPALCSVLVKADPPSEQRAQILWHLIDCLRADVSPIVLEQLPTMNVEDTAILSNPTIEALQKCIKNAEFSSKAVRVAALLSLDHPEAEKILLELLKNTEIEIDVSSLTLCVNALSILILERADLQLFDNLLKILSKHEASNQLLPILCMNLTSSVKMGFQKRLIEAIEISCKQQENEKISNDLKWQFCSLSLKDKPKNSWKFLLNLLEDNSDIFLEGILITLTNQYPLPGFQITQWNSIEKALSAMDPEQLKLYLKSTVFIKNESSLISFQKPPALKNKPEENHVNMTTRTVVGRHSWIIKNEKCLPVMKSEGNNWLKSLSKRSKDEFEKARKNSDRQQKTKIQYEIIDPFQDLPSFDDAVSPDERCRQAQMAMDMLAFIRKSSRKPIKMTNKLNKADEEKDDNPMRYWRKFAADFQLLKSVHLAPQQFPRELRHLDATQSRECHKVAIIYVGEGQEDKQSILSNTSGSTHFNYFVEGLGWPVTIGPTHLGYGGGLPVGQTAPYYATADTELIYHVSTQINGDANAKMKHIGNDEVHVVWCENAKRSYKRETLATRFCDVLIVLYPVSPVLIRVHIETQNPLLEFGPLFDGVYIHTKQISSLIRDTVINASRSYRLLQKEFERPNKLRERVFEQTRNCLTQMSVADSITQLYVPYLRS